MGGICRQDDQTEGWNNGPNIRGGRSHEDADEATNCSECLLYSSGPARMWLGRECWVDMEAVTNGQWEGG